MNPHFIFNALNSIQKFIIENDVNSSTKYLTKFARLMRLVLDNSQHHFVLLQNEIDAIELYLELESLRFKNKFNFQIIMENEINALTTKIPGFLIQPYVENSILHGLMHKKNEGSLIISLRQDNSWLRCIIHDNGIGREKSIKINLKKKQQHNSLGSKITETRIEILNSIYKKEMSVIMTI